MQSPSPHSLLPSDLLKHLRLPRLSMGLQKRRPFLRIAYILHLNTSPRGVYLEQATSHSLLHMWHAQTTAHLFSSKLAQLDLVALQTALFHIILTFLLNLCLSFPFTTRILWHFPVHFSTVFPLTLRPIEAGTERYEGRRR